MKVYKESVVIRNKKIRFSEQNDRQADIQSNLQRLLCAKKILLPNDVCAVKVGCGLVPVEAGQVPVLL